MTFNVYKHILFIDKVSWTQEWCLIADDLKLISLLSESQTLLFGCQLGLFSCDVIISYLVV